MYVDSSSNGYTRRIAARLRREEVLMLIDRSPDPIGRRGRAVPVVDVDGIVAAPFDRCQTIRSSYVL